MTNFEKMEELLYTDGEVRQQMEEHRRLRFRTTDATRHLGVELTEQSSDYTRTTLRFPQFCLNQMVEVLLAQFRPKSNETKWKKWSRSWIIQ